MLGCGGVDRRRRVKRRREAWRRAGGGGGRSGEERGEGFDGVSDSDPTAKHSGKSLVTFPFRK